MKTETEGISLKYYVPRQPSILEIIFGKPRWEEEKTFYIKHEELKKMAILYLFGFKPEHNGKVELNCVKVMEAITKIINEMAEQDEFMSRFKMLVTFKKRGVE